MTAPLATFEVVTLFPEMFRSVLEASLLGKAIERGLLAVHFTSPREFGLGAHKAVDDAPYGGGGGMVMRADILSQAIARAESERGPAHKVLLGPGGARLDRATVERLCRLPRVLLVCGRYEGIDDRLSACVDEELSLGDFVMTGGEIAAMAIIDACARRLPGVLGNESSPVEESFEQGLLEHPHFTRPAEWNGVPVPPELLSGDHAKVRRFRRQQALLRTRERRPDLFARHLAAGLGDEDRRLLAEAGPTPAEAARAGLAARTFVALCHHPVLDRDGAVITTAVTNLDIHDLARSARTYDLGGVFLVTPVEAQQALCGSILDEWRREARGEPQPGRRRKSAPAAGRGPSRNDHRAEALARVRVAPSLEEAEAAILRETGARPLLIATSARPQRPECRLGYRDFARVSATLRPVLLVFGTGWGLADGVLDRVDHVLPPIREGGEYNHLSVRSAAAITLDRLFSDEEPMNNGPYQHDDPSR